ncbi:MAG: hypothetical protein ACE5GB_00800 [Acidimicrobiales bacterium]
MSPGRLWRSVRFRITAVATLVVALVLGATSALAVEIQRRELIANVDHSLELRADEILADLASGGDPDVVFANRNAEDRLIQLVDDDGRVIAASPNLAGLTAVAPSPPGAERSFRVDSLPIEDDAFRMLSRRVETPEGPAVLHVAENIDDLDDVVRTLALTLAVGCRWWWLCSPPWRGGWSGGRCSRSRPSGPRCPRSAPAAWIGVCRRLTPTTRSIGSPTP